jgi:hypothetical protein
MNRTKQAYSDSFSEGRVLGSLSFHVNNGGLNFSLNDMGFGPTIHLEYEHFGKYRSSFDLDVEKEALTSMRNMCLQAVSEEDVIMESSPVRAQWKNKTAGRGSSYIELSNSQTHLEFGFEHRDRFGWYMKGEGDMNFHFFMECDQTSIYRMAELLEKGMAHQFSPSPDHAFKAKDTYGAGKMTDQDVRSIIQNLVSERGDS